MTQYLNFYEHCEGVWTMAWDCACDDRCPKCGSEIMPYRSFEMEEEVRECFFCKSREVISFKEHYTFCMECTAIYTECIVVESNCEHIKENAIIAEREPWFFDWRQNLCKKEIGYVVGDSSGRCSVCNAIAIADGW